MNADALNNIVNTGTITVEGNQSAGISIDSALTGSILNSGSISLTGNDTFGIRAQSVSGNVTLQNGSISVKGQNATGVSLGAFHLCDRKRPERLYGEAHRR